MLDSQGSCPMCLWHRVLLVLPSSCSGFQAITFLIFLPKKKPFYPQELQA